MSMLTMVSLRRLELIIENIQLHHVSLLIEIE